MVVGAIVACEVGFWVVLVAGLLTRYVLRRPRAGAALLLCVPLVDLALLVFTVVDLRRGTPPEGAHGLAAVYLGFSVAFGHAMVRWADVRVAHRFAGGPAPAPPPPAGSAARLRREWSSFGSACLAVGLSSALLLVVAALSAGDTAPLTSWIGRLGVLLVLWLLFGPLWEVARRLLAPAGGPSVHQPVRGSSPPT